MKNQTSSNGVESPHQIEKIGSPPWMVGKDTASWEEKKRKIGEVLKRADEMDASCEEAVKMLVDFCREEAREEWIAKNPDEPVENFFTPLEQNYR